MSVLKSNLLPHTEQSILINTKISTGYPSQGKKINSESDKEIILGGNIYLK